MRTVAADHLHAVSRGTPDQAPPCTEIILQHCHKPDAEPTARLAAVWQEVQRGVVARQAGPCDTPQRCQPRRTKGTSCPGRAAVARRQQRKRFLAAQLRQAPAIRRPPVDHVLRRERRLLRRPRRQRCIQDGAVCCGVGGCLDMLGLLGTGRRCRAACWLGSATGNHMLLLLLLLLPLLPAGCRVQVLATAL